MKIKHILLIALSGWQLSAHATDLLEVYQQAQKSDPIFQQAIAQRLATKEGVPINLSALLPNLSVNANPSVARIGQAGTNFVSTTSSSASFLQPRNNTQRAYTLSLSLTQTVFNYAQFAALANATATSKEADATLNAALQDLMIRVSKAYFAVLQDEDTLSYAEATKIAYAEQLEQMRQQFKVGLKTLTDVYTAQASYDSALATYIATEVQLANDKENLRAITGVLYPHLSSLSDQFPLITPQPVNMEQWVNTSIKQNWSVKANQYATQAALSTIHQQFAGHLPTVQLQGTASRQYINNINGYDTFTYRNGPGTTSTKEVQLNISVPVFAGGGVVAQTEQAKYNYQSAQQQLEQAVRNTVNTTRQSYQNITAGISKITADKLAIKSTISSLEGLEESYRVGTETLVNVLNQQQKVYEAQKTYAVDRYAFVNNILALKQAAGTLSFNDLRAINMWLVDEQHATVSLAKSKTIAAQRKKHRHQL